MPDENCKLRPCPYLSCVNHTWWLWFCEQGRPKRQGMMFAKMTDTQIIDFVENLPETCIIDVIQKNTTYDGKGATLNVIAGVMGVTRERVRQVEEKALNKIRNWRRRSLLQHHAKDVYGIEKDPYLTMLPWAGGIENGVRSLERKPEPAEALPFAIHFSKNTAELRLRFLFDRRQPLLSYGA